MVIGMNNNNQKVPKFRFSGLYNCWSEEELGEISVFNPPSELPDIFEYIDLESVQGTTILNHRTENIKTAPSRAQRLAQWGDIFYQTVRPYQKNNCLYELPYDNYVFSTGYAQIRTNLNKYFLFTYIQNEVFVSKVLERSTGTSYPSINTKDLSKIKIFFPGSYEEQEKIGSFFNKLDKTITLQQQLLNDHKQLKKAMLQKMFPQNGESVPRVRFARFGDIWKRDKIQNLLVERNERCGEGELLSVTINSGIIKFSNLNRTDNSSKDKSNYKKVEQNDIAYNSMRMWQGASGISKYSGIVSPAYTVIVPTEKISSLYISYQFKLPEMIQIFQANSQGLTSDTWNLKYPLLKKIKIEYPSFDEQEKIGKLFKQLDETITLHENKLENYQNFKKAMLQKMFV